MDTSKECIGVFDSGIGGLSVFKELKKKLPGESMLYIGDTLHIPYGPKPREKVQRLSYRLMGYLCGQGTKLVVAACNTANAAIIPEAISDFKTPVVGPIHAGAAAAYRVSKTKRIGVVATEGTINSGFYQKVLRDMDPRVEVITQAAPGFVDAVERGETGGPYIAKLVDHYLCIFNKKIDTLILGCTHFPFLKPAIEHYFADSSIEIIDPAVGLAHEVACLLEENGLLARKNQPVEYAFYATYIDKLNPAFLEIVRQELNLPSIQFKQLKI